MTRLQFGSYVFEYNPRKIELSAASALAAHLIPGYGSRTQRVGFRARTVRCEGEVFGPTAESAMEKLSALSRACCGANADTLYLPTGERLIVWPSRFGYAAQGDGRVLSYYVEFVECERPGVVS